MHDMGALCQVSTDFAATETNPQLHSKKAPCGRAQPMGPALVCFSSCSTILTYPSAHLHITIYTTPSTQHHLHYIINTTPSTLHHQHNTIYTTSSNTTSSTHTIYTTSSTQHHQHSTIYITPSTEHHLHNIITYWQVQHLEHCHLTPSVTFLLIPLLLIFVVASSLFCFVDLFHTWMSEDIVNMWGYPVLQ